MQTRSIDWGFWTDYDKSFTNSHQILVTEYWAGIFTNFIAVLITLCGKPIFNLSIWPLARLWERISSRWRYGQPVDLYFSHDTQDAVIEMIGGERYVRILLHGPAARIGRRSPREVLGRWVMAIIFLGFPTALIIASVLSSALANDSTARSNTATCGIYIYDLNLGNSSGQFLEYEHRAEAQAGGYAADCYGSSPLVDDCNRFYNQSIPYTINPATPCPFDSEVCDKPGNTSITFSTGLVPGSVLGINAINSYFFSRTMQCSPLVTGNEYIRRGISSRGKDQWEYWYGPSDAEYTWATPVHESSWEIKGYSTGIHCSAPGSLDPPPFSPRQGFTAGPNPVTIIFISSHTILYLEPRDDPVFPTDQEAKFPPDYSGPALYYKNSTQAGVLACQDGYQVCENRAGPCWDNGNISTIFDGVSSQRSAEEQNIVDLLLHALDYSTACGSIQYRGAEALNAQTKVAHMKSLPLATEQWKVEGEKMFQASLARIQLNVFDIVRGTASNFHGYMDIMPAEYRNICNMVKIPTSGWKNVNSIGFFGTMLAAGFVWIIGWKQQTGPGQDDKTLNLILIWRNWLRKPTIWLWNNYLKNFLWWAWEYLEAFLRWCGNGLHALMEGLFN